MAGLLDNLFATPNDQALWALGSGLLGVRRGNEGRALMGGMAAYNNAKEQDAEAEFRKLRLEQMQQQLRDPQLFGKIDPADFTTESLGKFQETKNYRDLVLNPRNSKAPAPLLEWDAFSKLSPEDQSRYLEMKRNPMVKDIGNVPSMVSRTGTVPLSTIEREAASGAQIAAAKKQAETTATGAATAALDLPSAEARIPVIEKQLQALINHPGRKYATGPLSVLPAIPGTPQADFINRHEQFKSVAFLQAFETLKGGGQITEIEGEKATKAMNRMDRSTSSKEYEAAAKDFLDAYKAGVAKLRSKAFPPGFMPPAEQARGVRDLGMTERVDRVPGADPLGIR